MFWNLFLCMCVRIEKYFDAFWLHYHASKFCSQNLVLYCTGEGVTLTITPFVSHIVDLANVLASLLININPIIFLTFTVLSLTQTNKEKIGIEFCCLGVVNISLSPKIDLLLENEWHLNQPIAILQLLPPPPQKKWWSLGLEQDCCISCLMCMSPWAVRQLKETNSCSHSYQHVNSSHSVSVWFGMNYSLQSFVQPVLCLCAVKLAQTKQILLFRAY